MSETEKAEIAERAKCETVKGMLYDVVVDLTARLKAGNTANVNEVTAMAAQITETARLYLSTADPSRLNYAVPVDAYQSRKE